MTLPIAAGTYGIDSAHTQLGFSVTHLGISVVQGRFDSFTGSLTVGASLADCVLTVDTEMASVSTGNAGRDGHMHGADFFDVENHPHMTFKSTAVSEAGDGYEVVGDLTLRGVTNSVTLSGTYNGSGVFPVDGSTHFGFSASGTISRSAFGVSYGVPMVTDQVELQLEAQFVEPAAE
ncbi:MAG: polyisoprenoid-binding protein YceI [Acidimicrobiales bacterium]|jgi:polyisoprenoid-binding protein YceI